MNLTKQWINFLDKSQINISSFLKTYTSCIYYYKDLFGKDERIKEMTRGDFFNSIKRLNQRIECMEANRTKTDFIFIKDIPYLEKKYNFDPGSASFVLEDITINYGSRVFRFGDFQVFIQDDRTIKVFTFLNNYKVNGYIHPHVSGCYSLCTGEYDQLIKSCFFSKDPDILGGVEIIERLLKTYNEASPFQQIGAWKSEVYCADCNTLIDIQERTQGINGYYCPQCMLEDCITKVKITPDRAVKSNFYEGFIEKRFAVKSRCMKSFLSTKDPNTIKTFNGDFIAKNWDKCVNIKYDESTDKFIKSETNTCIFASIYWVRSKYNKRKV